MILSLKTHAQTKSRGRKRRMIRCIVIDLRPLKLSRNVGNLSELQSPSPGGEDQTRITGDLVNFYFVVPFKTFTLFHSWEF